MTNNGIRSHDEYKADLAEHSLGILDGRARAELLAHVEGCEECAAEMAELTATVDALLHVPAGAEPPVGFESRVIERIRASRPAVIGRRRASPVLLSAAAAVVALAFGVGWMLDHVTTTSSPVQAVGKMEQRSLQAAGHDVGLVYAYTGQPSWMFVTVDAPKAPSLVRCVVVTKSGQRDFVGTFALVGGKGDWGTALPVPLSSVRGIVLTTTNGTVVARLADTQWSPSAGRWS
jgi:hypothetical protein